MKVLLTVVEAEDVSLVKFSIYPDQGEATKLRAQGSIKTVDPIEHGVSYLRLLGEFDTDEEAVKAAERYAAARYFVIGEWKKSNPMTPDGRVLSGLIATAHAPSK
jgi:hypothetical protein